jgi:hypothetical protein
MTRALKLIKRLLTNPKDFTFDELRKVMFLLNYIEDTKGMTSGSRVAFYNKDKNLILRLHKPHPRNELKAYQIKEIIEFLKRTGEIIEN